MTQSRTFPSPANKLSLQELNWLIEIELLASGFLEHFGSKAQFPGVGQMPILPPLRTLMVAKSISLQRFDLNPVY